MSGVELMQSLRSCVARSRKRLRALTVPRSGWHARSDALCAPLLRNFTRGRGAAGRTCALRSPVKWYGPALSKQVRVQGSKKGFTVVVLVGILAQRVGSAGVSSDNECDSRIAPHRALSSARGKRNPPIPIPLSRVTLDGRRGHHL